MSRAGVFVSSALLGYVAGRYVPHNVQESRKFRSSEAYLKFANFGIKVMQRTLDAENAHKLTVKLAEYGLSPVEATSALSEPQRERLQTTVWNKAFNSPLGLAAGFDKQAQAITGILDMGFAFVEVGGVPPEPQPGNPKPRMFRLLEDKAVINRFGLNSEGMKFVKERMQAFRELQNDFGAQSVKGGCMGANLAKNTVSTDATADFVHGMRELGPLTDFVVVNVSCPNVAWTKEYKGKSSALSDLILSVKKERDAMAKAAAAEANDKNVGAHKIPLLIKIGPDMSLDAKKDMAKLILTTGVDGVVVTNTSSERPEMLQSEHASETGGLSGEPIREKSLQTLRDIYKLTNGKVPLVGVGGISSAEDAYARIRAGASLIEIYTALVYQGPSLVQEIKRGVADLLERDGFSSVSEAVGADHR